MPSKNPCGFIMVMMCHIHSKVNYDESSVTPPIIESLCVEGDVHDVQLIVSVVRWSRVDPCGTRRCV